MSPASDMAVTISLSQSERRKLKHSMRATGPRFDVLSPKHKAEGFRKGICSIPKYTDISVDGSVIGKVCSNVGEVLRWRFERLMKNNRIQLFEDTVYVMLSGDKGGPYTKMGISFGTQSKQNSPSNIFVIGIYEGQDSRKLLEKNFSFKELLISSMDLNEQIFKIKW